VPVEHRREARGRKRAAGRGAREGGGTFTCDLEEISEIEVLFLPEVHFFQADLPVAQQAILRRKVGEPFSSQPATPQRT
jgi:hypothetical protein